MEQSDKEVQINEVAFWWNHFLNQRYGQTFSAHLDFVLLQSQMWREIVISTSSIIVIFLPNHYLLSD